MLQIKNKYVLYSMYNSLILFSTAECDDKIYYPAD